LRGRGGGKIVKMADKRNILFILFSIIGLIIFYASFKELFRHSFHEELYSHVILVPFVSGYFMYLRRKELFSDARYSYASGLVIILFGMMIYFIGSNQRTSLTPSDYLSLIIFSAVTFWIGGFLLFYGPRSFRVATFSLLFLFFLTPIPTIVVGKMIRLLQIGSTEAAYGLFKLTGVPILRDGFTFNLSGMSIEVAEQCSGIRSGLALVITSIVAGQLFLQTGWKKLILVLSAIPVTIMKNGLRIVTLSLLGTYVDPAILSSDLHKRGGIPFFILALVFMVPILWGLRKSEMKEKGSRRS
jgi:exosortase